MISRSELVKVNNLCTSNFQKATQIEGKVLKKNYTRNNCTWSTHKSTFTNQNRRFHWLDYHTWLSEAFLLARVLDVTKPGFLLAEVLPDDMTLKRYRPWSVALETIGKNNNAGTSLHFQSTAQLYFVESESTTQLYFVTSKSTFFRLYFVTSTSSKTIYSSKVTK